jgi:hypothetical protein
MASQVFSMCNGAASRARLFQQQGVTLQFPARSRSGVRDYDGVVVFAMAAAEVRRHDWGFSCLLWTPASSDGERLEHCRLARRCGIAEGFLWYGDEATSDREGTLALRVVKASEEYWARWGYVARTELPQGWASAWACA